MITQGELVVLSKFLFVNISLVFQSLMVGHDENFVFL